MKRTAVTKHTGEQSHIIKSIDIFSDVGTLEGEGIFVSVSPKKKNNIVC